jgi:hypothetical protein
MLLNLFARGLFAARRRHTAGPSHYRIILSPSERPLRPAYHVASCVRLVSDRFLLPGAGHTLMSLFGFLEIPFEGLNGFPRRHEPDVGIVVEHTAVHVAIWSLSPFSASSVMQWCRKGV